LTPPCGSLRSSAKLTTIVNNTLTTMSQPEPFFSPRHYYVLFLQEQIKDIIILTNSSRMHGEFLLLLFLQAHLETDAHFNATGLPSQQNQSDNVFLFKHAAFYMGLKSKVGLVVAKASGLRINLNIQVCSVVTPPLHAPFFSPSSFHTISLSPAFTSV
jgi:hypothetical protein